jgi:hypothetical protein
VVEGPQVVLIKFEERREGGKFGISSGRRALRRRTPAILNERLLTSTVENYDGICQ